MNVLLFITGVVAYFMICLVLGTLIHYIFRLDIDHHCCEPTKSTVYNSTVRMLIPIYNIYMLMRCLFAIIIPILIGIVNLFKSLCDSIEDMIDGKKDNQRDDIT